MSEIILKDDNSLSSAMVGFLEEVQTAIAEKKDISQIIKLERKGSALRDVLKKAKATREAQNAVAEAGAWLRYAVGEMLEDMEKSKGGRPVETGCTMQPVMETLTYADLGIEKTYAHRCQTLASIPEEKIREKMEEIKSEPDGEITTAAIMKLVQRKDAALRMSNSNEWYTPPKYIEAAREVMGGIDIDPASCEDANKTVRATVFYDKETDGLKHDWPGRVWLNPPYGGLSGSFTEMLVDQYASGITKEAVLLVNANSTDTNWFQPLWDYLLCFTDHRIDFISPGENKNGPTHGSVFIYFGDNENRFAEVFSQYGTIVKRWFP